MPTGRLSAAQKIGWGLADLGVASFVVIKQLLVLAFLTQYLGVPIAWAGVLTSAILIFDMVTDPAIGYLSDHCRSRWGRRAPFMAAGAAVLALGSAMIFAAPAGAGVAAKLAWVGGFFALATLGFTCVGIPYGAQAGEMTQDARERSAMTAWRMGFAALGLLIGGALIPLLAARMGHFMAVLAFAPVIIGAIWGSLWLTRKAPRIDTPPTGGAAQMARLVWRNRAFIVLTALYALMTLGIAIITAGLPFATLYLIADGQPGLLSGAARSLGTLSLMFACFVIGAIVSQAPWVLASARLGKVGALLLGLSLYVLLLFALQGMLPTTSVTAIGGMFVLAGMTNGAYQQIPWAIYPDLMDVTRAQSGQAVEGAFSAVWMFGQKLANALGPLLLSVVLAAAGFAEGTQGAAVPQSDAALHALRAAVTWLPAGILALSALLVLTVYRPLERRAFDTT